MLVGRRGMLLEMRSLNWVGEERRQIFGRCFRLGSGAGFLVRRVRLEGGARHDGAGGRIYDREESELALWPRCCRRKVCER
jgi:hypothetical protein